MATKKTPAKRYIAITEHNDSIVYIGSLDQIAEAITDYCEFQDCSPDEVQDEVTIYEIGEQLFFNVNTKVEVTF